MANVQDVLTLVGDQGYPKDLTVSAHDFAAIAAIDHNRVARDEQGPFITYGTATFRLKTPAAPFRVKLSVGPTFSPAAHGSSDTRQLGAQVAFAFEPRSEADG